jgi:MOSC domain-containing protein YiiM
VDTAAAFRISHLFISPGHNFFGHHEQSAGTHPLLSQPEVECVAGRGLRGDRFFDYKPDYKGQVTFLAAEVFAEVCRSVGVTGLSPGVARRNVITQGVDLNTLVGKRFTLQGIAFEGVSECSPCEWMDQAIGPGAAAALHGRGGLRARILSSGPLRVDA